MHQPIRRRRAGILATLLAAGLAVAVAVGSAGAARKLDNVTVQLDWVPRGNHAMFYVAKEKGYFKQQGIDVTSITPGKGSALTMQLVGHGQADFGFGDLPTLAVARSQGIPVVALAAVNERSPMAMCSFLAEHPLLKPADMKGLRVGVSPSGSTFIFYKSLLAATGTARDDMKEFTVPAPYENYLLQRKVDMIPCYIDAELPILRQHAGNQKLSVLIGSQWGYDALGSGLLTSDTMIKTKPGVVQRFVTAYVKAFNWVIDNPQKAAKIVADSSDETKGQEALYTQQLGADIANTFMGPMTLQYGLGYMPPSSWAATVKTLVDTGQIESAPPLSSLYDNRFVLKNPIKKSPIKKKK